MGKFEPYSPAKNVLTIDGHTAHGFQKGTFIEVTLDSDGMTDEAGSDGEVCIVEMIDPRGTMKVTLQQNSETNDIMTDLAKSKTIFSLSLVELNAPQGRDMRVRSDKCYVKKIADIKRADTAQATEWSIRMLAADPDAGGLDDGTVD
jgi:hypothetical protein